MTDSDSTLPDDRVEDGSEAAEDSVVAAFLAEGLSEEDPETRDLGARYAVTGRLGQGGQGGVLEGRDVELERAVAMKVLRGSAAPAEEDLLRGEARIAGGLDHPGIPHVFDLGTDGAGSPFVVMRKVEGDSLEAVLEGSRGSKPNAPRLVACFMQVGQTVAYAHSKGVLHLDLKPGNIALGRYGEVSVLDWGFATRKDQPLRLRGGTPIYAAPEQLRGEACDERADVYSLGAILYRILAGCEHVELPRTGIEDCLRMLESTFPRRLRARGIAVSKGLDSVVMKAVARRRDDRYQSVPDFLADLERALAGSPVTALAEGAGGRLKRSARRLGGPIIAGALVLAAFGGAIYLAWRISGNRGPLFPLRLEGGSDAPRRRRARLPYELARELFRTGGSRDEVAGLLDESVEIDPTFADALAARGRLRLAVGDASGAVADLRRAAEVDPSQTGALYGAGLIELESGNIDSARADFEGIGELDGGSILRKLGLARAHLVEGKPAVAIAMLDGLEGRASSFPELWRVLGAALGQGGGDHYDPDRAYECFGRAIEIEGPTSALHLARARVAAAGGRPRLALAELRGASLLGADTAAAELEMRRRIGLEHIRSGRLGPAPWILVELSSGPGAKLAPPPVEADDVPEPEPEIEPEPEVTP